MKISPLSPSRLDLPTIQTDFRTNQLTVELSEAELRAKITELINQGNSIDTIIQDILVNLTGMVTQEVLKDVNKLDKTNFTGSWHGIKKPSLTNEGISGTVVKLEEDKQDKKDDKLTTRDKNIVGGINEINLILSDSIQDINKIKNNYAKIDYVVDVVKDKASIKFVNDSVAKLSSGTPLFAESTTQMKDTTKNYVNTSDGYLYIYEGSSWVKTNVKYQSTGIEDNSVTYEKTNFMNENLNLYDPSLAIDGKIIVYNSGNLVEFPTSATSGKIKVGLGEWNLSIPQTENGIENVIRCFDNDKSYLGTSQQMPGSTLVDGITVKKVTSNKRKQLQITITNPKIGYIESSIIHPYAEHNLSEFDRIRKSIQLQRGISFTEFEKYKGKGVIDYECLPYELIDKLKELENKSCNNSNFKIIKKDNDFFLISDWNENENLVQTLSITSQNNGLFNFGVIGTIDKNIVNPEIKDIKVKKSCVDDIAPPNINGVYIGANHGFSKVYNITCHNHNKTVSDIGSEWIDSTGTKFYIIKIVDINTLQIISENKGQSKWDFIEVNGNLTHSKNATNKNEIIITNKIASQWYPSIKNREINIMIDNRVVNHNGTYLGSELIVEESYYINDVTSTLDYFKNNVGRDIDISRALSIDNVARIFNKYIFQSNGACVIEGKFEAIKDIDLGYIGFTQSIAPINSGAKLMEYIPNTIEVNGKNFSKIVDITSPSSINITSEYWESKDNPPSRFCQLVNNNVNVFGFSYGYESRAKKVSNALNIFTTNKNYPHYIDGGVLKKNEIVKTKCFRCPINYNLDDEATNISWYNNGDSIILMVDYHKNVNKSLELGIDFYDKNIEILDSKNFELLTSKIEKTIDFNISNNYGYAILKIK